MAREYITTAARLREVQIAQIGTLHDTHEAMVTKAAEEASKVGVTKPLIVVDFRFKPGAHPAGLESYIYPINPDEWLPFRRDLWMCSEDPTVHVVDGEKYTAPI